MKQLLPLALLGILAVSALNLRDYKQFKRTVSGPIVDFEAEASPKGVPPFVLSEVRKGSGAKCLDGSD